MEHMIIDIKNGRKTFSIDISKGNQILSPSLGNWEEFKKLVQETIGKEEGVKIVFSENQVNIFSKYGHTSILRTVDHNKLIMDSFSGRTTGSEPVN
jgi:hypothetical protein